jgi:hypothetical protein
MTKTESERRVEIYDRAWNGLNDAMKALDEVGHFPEMRKTLSRFRDQVDDAIDAECRRQAS